MSAAQHPLILGHRGASAHAPDNTLRAYALAVAQNADGIELDVRRTADGELVLHHDAAVEGVGRLIDLTLEEVRAALPDVPTLDEMLAVTRDLLLNIEIKNHPGDPDFDPEHTLAYDVVRWVETQQLAERVVVSSFNWDTTARCRDTNAAVPTGQLLWGAGTVADYAPEVADRGHQWILPPDAMLGDTAGEQIQLAHDHGLQVVVWTVDDPHRMTQLAASGIDGIITNDPALAHDTLT